MRNSRENKPPANSGSPGSTITTMVALAATILLASVVANAQTFGVIHSFTNGIDGAAPVSGLAIDQAGNLYGAAFQGGNHNCVSGCGLVFKMSPHGAFWLLNPLYVFAGGADGARPKWGNLTIAPDGRVYGTTASGGGGTCTIDGVAGCGTVFRLAPRPTGCPTSSCPWLEDLLYTFTGQADGSQPTLSLTLDQQGDVYGVARNYPSPGNAYELVRSGNTFTHNLLYTFNGSSDGCFPTGSMILSGGNLYGASSGCGIEGAFWELTPSGAGWSETIQHQFPQDSGEGSDIQGGLIQDSSGNLYGFANFGGPNGGGTAFELSQSNGMWSISRFYGFSGTGECGPWGTPAMDAAGNIYGTTICDGANGAGSIFKLAPTDGTWAYTELYSFTSGSDGAQPLGGVTLGLDGALYGTASMGGTFNANCPNGCGVVWKLVP